MLNSCIKEFLKFLKIFAMPPVIKIISGAKIFAKTEQALPRKENPSLIIISARLSPFSVNLYNFSKLDK